MENATVSNARTNSLYDDALIAEYNALHQESMQGFSAVQSILQWSLAAIGVIFAGALVFVGQQKTLDGLHVVFFCITFGVGLPWLSTFASWLWIGECWRLVRTAAYLRSFEASMDLRLNSPDTPPMQWYRYIGYGPIVGSAQLGKSRVEYVGGLGIYLGAVVFPIGIALPIALDNRAVFGGWIWPLLVAYVLVILLHVAMDIVQGLAILKHEHTYKLPRTCQRFARR